MRHQHLLDLGRPDFEPGDVDHPFAAISDEEEAVSIDMAYVASHKELLPIAVHIGGLSFRWPAEISAEQLRRSDDEFSIDAGRARLSCVKRDDTRFNTLEREADRSRLRRSAGIHMCRRHGFSHAEPLDIVQAGDSMDTLVQRNCHGSATATQEL